MLVSCSQGKHRLLWSVKQASEMRLLSLFLHSIRFNTSEKLGLDTGAAKSRLDRNGKNVMSRPPSNLPKKIFNYMFGGFAGILWIAGILACLSWKPIGEPDPQAINLYIGCVIFLVIVIQIAFTVWQDYTT